MTNSRRVFLLAACVFWLTGAIPTQAREADPPAVLRPRDLTAFLIGHAHIDLAWLWRWEETVHDIATHTFRGTLAQMDKMPGLTFAQSQAAVYEAIEKNDPELFEKIRERVKAGTWIPVGGMWAEPDLNMPDGESFARQLLYGKKYFAEKFGVDVTVGWNPDSFGHNFQLPQILRKAGIKYYVFERCAPENTTAFWWEGQDGSRVLAYVPPGWYLVDLKTGVKDLLLKAAAASQLKEFMLLYGEGDHGGGPRSTDLEAIRKFKAAKDHPRIEFVAPEAYFRKLESAAAAFPVVKRELNFTFPACYTTQAETKKYNRLLENLLLTAEKFSAVAMAMGLRSYYPDRDIDEAWKTVLRNQFHDILDGSSIGPVYEESRRFYEEARERGKRALDFSLETFTDRVDSRGEGIPVLVYNPLFWERTEPVETVVTLPAQVQAVRVADSVGREVPAQVLETSREGDRQTVRLVFIAEEVPSFGYKTFRVSEAAGPPAYQTSLKAGPAELENDFLKLALNPKTGWMQNLYDKKNGRQALAGEGNILQAIVDEPESMSAWELGLKEVIANIGETGAAVEILEQGPVRAAIRVKSVFRNSLFVQDIILYDRVPRVDCLLRLDWQERNLMIKAAFPAAVRNAAAEFEIPYGSVSRPADGTEVPALRWIDLTDASGDYGLSLLNDSKYGFDVKDNIMRISLVRGATSPDPEADRGAHTILYSLYPHAGSFKEAATVRRGYELNNPLLARVAMVHAGDFPPERAFIRVSPENVILSAVKKESDYFSREVILRAYEAFGKETEAEVELPGAFRVRETDLLERPLAKIEPDGRILRFKINPHEIKTFRIALEPGR